MDLYKDKISRREFLKESSKNALKIGGGIIGTIGIVELLSNCAGAPEKPKPEDTEAPQCSIIGFVDNEDINYNLWTKDNEGIKQTRLILGYYKLDPNQPFTIDGTIIREEQIGTLQNDVLTQKLVSGLGNDITYFGYLLVLDTSDNFGYAETENITGGFPNRPFQPWGFLDAPNGTAVEVYDLEGNAIGEHRTITTPHGSFNLGEVIDKYFLCEALHRGKFPTNIISQSAGMGAYNVDIEYDSVEVTMQPIVTSKSLEGKIQILSEPTMQILSKPGTDPILSMHKWYVEETRKKYQK